MRKRFSLRALFFVMCLVGIAGGAFAQYRWRAALFTVDVEDPAEGCEVYVGPHCLGRTPVAISRQVFARYGVPARDPDPYACAFVTQRGEFLLVDGCEITYGVRGWSEVTVTLKADPAVFLTRDTPDGPRSVVKQYSFNGFEMAAWLARPADARQPPRDSESLQSLHSTSP
jgi:hypothetical protein